MITNLTKKQKSKMRDYSERWLKNGLSIDNVSFEKAESIINNFYENVLLKEKPNRIIISENPLDCWKELSNYYVKKYNVVSRHTFVKTISNNVIMSRIDDVLDFQIDNSVYELVYSEFYDTIEKVVYNKIADIVFTTLEDKIEEISETNETKKFLCFSRPHFSGHFMSSYFAFYDYFINEKIIKLDDNIIKGWESYKETSKIGLIYPFDDICFLCQKPVEIKLENSVMLVLYKGNFRIVYEKNKEGED